MRALREYDVWFRARHNATETYRVTARHAGGGNIIALQLAIYGLVQNKHRRRPNHRHFVTAATFLFGRLSLAASQTLPCLDIPLVLRRSTFGALATVPLVSFVAREPTLGTLAPIPRVGIVAKFSAN